MSELLKNMYELPKAMLNRTKTTVLTTKTNVKNVENPVKKAVLTSTVDSKISQILLTRCTENDVKTSTNYAKTSGNCIRITKMV